MSSQLHEQVAKTREKRPLIILLFLESKFNRNMLILSVAKHILVRYTFIFYRIKLLSRVIYIPEGV